MGVVRIETNSGNGTGVIFETTGDGKAYVLTNYHVVEGFGRINVKTNNGNNYPATLKGYDAYKDLAVLETCCSRFRSLPFADATAIRSGSEVIAIGYPLGFTGAATVTRGIVSAVRYDSELQAWVIQTDASINPGNSGGPLLTLQGDIAGINTYTHDWSSTGRPVDGVGFAVSEQTIRDVLQDLKLGRKVGIPTPTATPTPMPTSTTVPVRWRTYTNNFHRFSVDFPWDWKLDDSESDFVSISEPSDFAFFQVFVPDWYIISANEELHDWLGRQQRDENPVVYELLESDTHRDTEGVQTAYARYRYQSELKYCVDVVEEVLVVSAGARQAALWIESRVCEHSYQEFQPVINAIFESFKAID